MKYCGTYRIWGPPGTGKTSFLTRQVNEILRGDADAKILICSLTRTAAREIASRNEKLAEHRVGTLHAHAFRALENPPITETFFKDWNELHPRLSIQNFKPDVDDVFGEVAGGSEGEKQYQQIQLLRAMMRPVETWSTKLRSFAEKWNAFKEETSSYDFTDLIEAAAEQIDEAPYESEIVIADEAQDLSRLEMKLLTSWGRACGTLMIAGDPNQALYTWRGADPTVFTSPKEDLPEPSTGEDRQKVLSKSYRLSKAVHKVASRWIRKLSTYTEADFAPREEEGSVRQIAATWKSPDDLIRRVKKVYSNTDKSIMIMVSCSYMLKNIIRELRAAGLPFANPWRTRRGDWNPLQFGSKKVSPRVRVLDLLRADVETFGSNARGWSWEEAKNWLDLIRSRDNMFTGAKKVLDKRCGGPAKSDKAEIGDILNGDAFESFAKCTKTEEWLDWIGPRLLAAKQKSMAYPIEVARKLGGQSLLTQERIYVGTIHSFKGGEADVCYLAPDLSYAALNGWVCGGEERDSVVRMFYVGLTRAREAVRILSPAVSNMTVVF